MNNNYKFMKNYIFLFLSEIGIYIFYFIINNQNNIDSKFHKLICSNILDIKVKNRKNRKKKQKLKIEKNKICDIIKNRYMSTLNLSNNLLFIFICIICCLFLLLDGIIKKLPITENTKLPTTENN